MFWQPLAVTAQDLFSLLEGAQVTLKAAFVAELIALCFGLALVLIQLIQFKPLQILVKLYISFIRGTPSLIQIFIIYFVVPTLLGIPLEAFQAGCIAVGMNSAAFVSEIYRGGLSAVPKGQIEAAKAIGMPLPLVWRRILIPQLFVLTLPGLVTEFVFVVQNTSLLSIISVVELSRKSQQIVSVNQQPLQIYALTGLIYFIICFVVSLFARRLYQRKIIAYQG